MPLQGVEILNLKKKKSQSCFWCTALFISSLHKYNFLNPKVFHSLHFKHQNKDILKIIIIFRPFVMVLTHFFYSSLHSNSIHRSKLEKIPSINAIWGVFTVYGRRSCKFSGWILSETVIIHYKKKIFHEFATFSVMMIHYSH